jgi:VWFA-related protein
VKLNRICATSFAVLACAGAVAAQNAAPPPEPTQGTPLRVSTKLITVSAVVRDKHGAAIADLTKDDFAILDGKTQRPVDVFTVTRASVAAPEPKQLPPDTYSNDLAAREDSPANLTIILLDSLNTPAFDRSFPRAQIKKMLLTLQPTDRVALYALGSRLRVLHEFSSDASALLDALNKNEDVELLDVDTPPSPGNSNLRNVQLIPLAEENAAVTSAQHAGNRAALTATALRSIAEHVSYLPGRKSLIWISDDFPLTLDFGALSVAPSSDGKKQPTTENELVARAVDQAHLAIYPIDARGLESSNDSLELDADPDAENAKQNARLDRNSSMQALARRTGGRAFTDTNGIMKSVRETIDASRVTYELGFYPGDVEWDGSFHKLTVKVNRKDAQVDARDGYFALGDPAPSPELLSATLVDAARGRIEETGIRFMVHVEPPAPTPDDASSVAAAGAAGKRSMKVTLTFDPSQFALRPAPVQSSDKTGALIDTIAIAFVAFDAKNQMLERAGVSLPFKLDAANYDRAVKEGVHYTRTVNLPPGATELRVVVYDSGNARVGSVRVPAAPQNSN